MQNNNICINLLAQFNKVFLHNRQGSYKTKYRYAEAFKRFLSFLAENYRAERIANIAPKHIYAYVDKLQERNLSPAYIKTVLSAIRFYHDKIPNAKFNLPDNNALNLQRRTFGGVDRTWSSAEFNRFVAKAIILGHEEYAANRLGVRGSFMKRSKYVAVIHPPKRVEDMEKLLHEISRFRAEKTIKYLRDNDITGKQLTNILQELQNT